MKRLVILFVGVTIGVQVGARAQSADQKPPAFEVASIKLHTSPGPSRGRIQPGRFSAENVPLQTLIRQAFDVLPSQIESAPDWIEIDRFDVVAKAPDGAAFPASLAPMLRGLLHDRFGLRTHVESRERPVFDLVMARTDHRAGPKLMPSSVDCTVSMMTPARVDGRGGNAAESSDGPLCAQFGTIGRLTMRGFPMARLAKILTPVANRAVIDKTGLTGTWNLELEFTPDQPSNIPADALPPGVTLPSPDAPSLPTALQEQLGLKLAPTKASVDVLVIDHVERPTPD